MKHANAPSGGPRSGVWVQGTRHGACNGRSLAEVVRALSDDAVVGGDFIVLVDGGAIPRARWAVTMPDDRAHVEILSLVDGG